MSVIEQTRETVVAPVTRREVLHRAADLLEEFGWCQGWYGSKAEGGFCLIGAVHQAAVDFGVNFLMTDAITMHLYRDGNVTDWNDQTGRTKTEVVARLREAAESA